MKPVRVLIVDDSPAVRSVIRAMLCRDPAIEVIGEAGDPHEARSAIKALNPNVITLDVEMPKMNGLQFLDKIMRLHPTPVIMVSSLTSEGADAALAALEMGAFDCVGKPSSGERDQFAKVKTAAECAPRSIASSTRRALAVRLSAPMTATAAWWRSARRRAASRRSPRFCRNSLRTVRPR